MLFRSNNLFVFNTGISRQASSVLSTQVENLKNDASTIENTIKTVEYAEVAISYLINAELSEFGKLLDTAWNTKKKLAGGISNAAIDKMYEDGLKNGALGGKLLGAGGGGYMLFYVPEKNHRSFTKKMIGYESLDFNFTEQGSTVEMFRDV